MVKANITGLTGLTGKPLSVTRVGNKHGLGVNLVNLVNKTKKSSHNPQFHWKSRGNNQASTKVWGGILNTPPEFYCTWSNFPKLIAPFSVRACLIKQSKKRTKK